MSSETIDVKFEHIKTFSFLHGELPIHLVDEVNNYVDEKGEINLDDDTPKGLCNLLKASGQSFVGLYSEQLPLSMDGNSFENVPVECENMRIIEKTERTYTHLLDYDTDYTTKSISFTIIIYVGSKRLYKTKIPLIFIISHICFYKKRVEYIFKIKIVPSHIII